MYQYFYSYCSFFRIFCYLLISKTVSIQLQILDAATKDCVYDQIFARHFIDFFYSNISQSEEKEYRGVHAWSVLSAINIMARIVN